MYSISTIQKHNAEASAKAIAEAQPHTSYQLRPNGDVLVALHPPGQRRSSRTLTGQDAAEFRSELARITTKTGKVPQRGLDRLIGEILLPAPTYEVLSAQGARQITLTKRRNHDILARKVLGPRVSARFQAERDSITINPERAPRKYQEAVQRLAASYF